MRLIILSIALMGCENSVVIEKIEDGTILLDLDGDGFLEDEDCDDNDAQINSAMSETCDGIDNNCDGQIDEDVLATFYLDEDGDGFGNPEISGDSCDPPEEYVPSGTDCDDSDAEIYVGNNEYCDGIDNNCDGAVDEGISQTYYADTDGDGFGDTEQPQSLCQVTEGYVLDSTDCDDSSSIIYPAAPDYCDGLDNDCDGTIDEDDNITQYFDEDGDGYGSELLVMQHCELLEQYVPQAGDCDDIDPQINPGADELCDGLDNNCDGTTDDDAIDRSTWYVDDDADSFGELGQSTLDCNQPTGYVSDSTDCNDSEALIYPQAAEVCDGIDNDCDSLSDDADPDVQNQPTWYLDADNDSYGADSITTISCNQPLSYTGVGGDCDDLNNQIFPTGTEVCDGLDNDCNGQTDEGLELIFYLDDDGDSYGDVNSLQMDCTQPLGYVTNADDCDDTEELAWTGNTETCDSVDNDCNGQIDEGVLPIWYLDLDGDGYGTTASVIEACSSPSTAYVALDGDCDDSEITYHPNAPIGCADIDQNCDGIVDQDNDGDGFSDYNCGGSDCDDSDISMFPNAAGDCPFGTDCLDILQQGYASSGEYNIDPDGHNVGVDAEDVWCEQQEYGGGWTLAGLNDPSNNLWNSTNIRDVNGFGDFSGGDYKSGLVFTELGFTDMMFTDGILYAVYENMGNGSESYLEFSDSIPHWNCAPGSGYEWGMTAGNLSGGSLCDTNLYMHPIDRDGYGNCNPYAQWSGNASGPTWSVTNNGSCPLDDPSSTSFISVTSSTLLPWSTTVPFYMYIR